MRGEAVFFSSAEAIADCAPSNEQRRFARRLGLRCVICQPLVRRGTTIGVVMFAMGRSGRDFEAADLALARDLAERVSIVVENARLITEMRETTEDLRHANAAKDEFLGMVSHELKTPITTIKGNADILLRSFDSLDASERDQSLDDISSHADRLDRLIDNMLILARLERGHSMDVEPLILPRVVQRVVDDQRRKHPERQITIRARGASLPILAAPEYIEQVVSNLVGNAEKYSPEGVPIQINIRGRRDEVFVDVLDRGAGISADEAELIFEPFYRSPRTAGQAGGVGVGLALCQRVIEAQNGRLWARPRRGGGSDFGFALPVIDEVSEFVISAD